MISVAKKIAEETLDYAKGELIDFAKKQLLKQLEEKLKQGDASIDALFDDLKNKLINYTVLDKKVLQTIIDGMCDLKQEEKVKTELKEQIEKINFTEELEKMPEKMPEEIKNKIITLSKTLKEQLNKLIDEIITCNAPTTTVVEPAPATLGGSKQLDRKQKRRQKTKKRIYKKSRGRRQYSRK